MMSYLLKRLAWFVPTGIIISLLAFALSKFAPGDPADLRNSAVVSASFLEADRLYGETTRLLGLDKPIFYFAVRSAAHPDTLHRVFRKERRNAMLALLGQYGNWPAVQAYYEQIHIAFQESLKLRDAGQMSRSLRDMLALSDPNQIRAGLGAIQAQIGSDSLLFLKLNPSVASIHKKLASLQSNRSRYKLYIPVLHWHGFDNQYHHWLAGLIKGDFGTSYLDGRPVGKKVSDGLVWTFRLNLISIFMAFGIAIPLGVWSANKVGGRLDRWTTVLLFMAYSVPVFWLATLLQVFFTTPEYGLDWFPSTGLSELDAGASWWARFADQAVHLSLPIFCLTLGALAFIARQMRGGMLQVLGMEYIKTARAKGLSARLIIWKHAFRNALFPIITLIGSVFPSLLAGSVVIEVIFGIPGMGKLSVDAIFARDWPVVFAILMMGALLTMAGIFLSDVLYALADPRVRHGVKK